MYVMDFHSHFVYPPLLEACLANSVQTGFGARPSPRLDDTSGKGAVYAKMADRSLYIEHMDSVGIDATVVSLSTVLQNSAWAPVRQDVEMTRIVNDAVAEWVREAPERFIGSFTLPLQDMEESLAELSRAVDALGLAVLNLPAHANGRYLGEEYFDPLWERIQEAAVPVFIHPSGITDPWYQDYRMWNSIGQSVEEAKVMASLIYGGMLDRYPELKIVIAHGGGFLPHYMGRMDRNVRNYPDSARNIQGKPSDYLQRFYYDTCVYDLGVLEALVAKVGADRLVLGSDYPVGEPDPVAFVRGCSSLTEAEVAAIAGGTARQLIGDRLSPSRPRRASQPITSK